MSVTFSAQIPASAIRVFRLTCEVQGPLGDWTGLENAYSEAEAHALVCTDGLCQGYGADVDEVSDLPTELNMANANAERVLDVLGYDTTAELAGMDQAEAFLGRVLMALALAPHDEGMPAHQMVGGGNHIDCGRRAGYLQDRLGQLRGLAT